jgi:hypothetical protein
MIFPGATHIHSLCLLHAVVLHTPRPLWVLAGDDVMPCTTLTTTTTAVSRRATCPLQLVHIWRHTLQCAVCWVLGAGCCVLYAECWVLGAGDGGWGLGESRQPCLSSHLHSSLSRGGPASSPLHPFKGDILAQLLGRHMLIISPVGGDNCYSYEKQQPWHINTYHAI